jgi:hypothetical protein
MNGCKLYDLLERIPNVEQMTLAHPYKTRVIAEGQVKTDKIDARMLATFVAGHLIAEAHISSKEARRLDLAVPDFADLFGHQRHGVSAPTPIASARRSASAP